MKSVTISRRRCLEFLRRSNSNISWIYAPSGTGKSHLLSQVAEEFSGITILFQIEDGDVDSGRFFRSLARSTLKAQSGIKLPAFGPEDVIYLRSFACRFFEHIEDQTASRILFALDDMQHLSQAPELLDALASAVANLTDRVSFVIASREAPPGSWAKLTADGRMAKVGPNMLFMDAEEIRRLLSAHPDWNHDINDSIVHGLVAATQGWASGLGVLIALAKMRPEQDRPFGEAEARGMVFESFSDQIGAAFSPVEQRQLMLVAPCQALYPTVLRDVLGGEICELLERLYLNGMLVAKDYTDSDEALPCYRLHALLRNFLRHKGKQDLHPEEQRDVCTRMAQKLLAMGEEDAACDLFMEAQDWPRLAEHLEKAAERFYVTGRIRSLTQYLTVLPAAVRDEEFQLGYWHGLCLRHVDPVNSRRELEVAYARFKARGDQATTIRVWGALIDAIWFEWDDCSLFDSYLEDLPKLRATAESLSDPELMAILTKGAFAALSMRRPDHPDFVYWEARNLELFQRRLPRSETIHRGLQLMIHYVYGRGERRKAEVVLARLRQIYQSDSESVADHCGYLVVNTAYQFWFSPDDNQAPATALTGLAVTERLKLPFWDVPLLNAAMFRVASDEDLDELRNMLALLDDRLNSDSREPDIAISHYFVAYRAWLEGDHEKALIAIEAACRIALESGFAMSPIYYGVGKAAVLESLGRRPEALKCLSLARHGAVNQKSQVMSFMAHMVGAAIALHAGRDAFVLAYLKHALKLGARERFCTALWLRLADRRRLCDMAVMDGIEPDYAKALGAMATATAIRTERPAICALGRADILINNRSELSSRKPQVMPLLLMLHLIAAGSRGRTSDQLIDAIWPDADTETGRQRLKTTLYRLRNLLGNKKSISSAGGHIRIDGSWADVDAWQIEDLIARQGDQIETAEQILSIYQDGFVDLYSGHIDLIVYRERVAQMVEGVILSAGKYLMVQEEWDRAAALLEKGAERCGLGEEFYCYLKECLEKAGRKVPLARLEERWEAEC